MANRDENLKKIRDELEKLSDEELEKIAGGMHLREIKETEEFPDDKRTKAMKQGSAVGQADKYHLDIL